MQGKKWITMALSAMLATGVAAACAPESTDRPETEQGPEIVCDLNGTTLYVYPPRGAEYSIDGEHWQTEGAIKDLTRGETYTLSMRLRSGSGTSEKTIYVPQQKVVDVYLIGGQSNALGISYASQLLDEDDKKLLEPMDDVLIYAAGETNQNGSGHVNQWTTVRGGLGLNGETFGLEIGMADVFRDYYLPESSEDDTVAIIKYTWGGTDLFHRWLPPTSYENGLGYRGSGELYRPLNGRICGDLYGNFVNTVQTQMQALRARGFLPRIRGMAWMQGEADATSSVATEQYTANLKNLISDLRSALDVPEMPFVIGEIDCVIAGFENDIRADQKQVAEETEHAYFISTADLEMGLWDWYHFYAPDMITLGRRFGSALIGAARAIPVCEGQSYEISHTVGSDFAPPQFVRVQTADNNERLAYVEWKTPSAEQLTAEGSFTLTGRALWEAHSTPVSATVTVTDGITLDGTLNEARWQQCKQFELGDGRTTFFTFYDEQGIYVGVTVQDDTIVTNIATGNFDGDMRTHTDNVSLYFETTGQTSAARTAGMSLFWLSANNILRVYQTDENATWNAGNKYLAQTQMNVRRSLKIDGAANQPGYTSKGYCMEFFIPFETLGITAQDIPVLRWNIEVTQVQQNGVMGTVRNLSAAPDALLNFDNTDTYVRYTDYAIEK